MGLTRNDILDIMTIIDLASQKGVFKAVDMAAVGRLYEKLNALNKEIVEKTTKENDQATNP